MKIGAKERFLYSLSWVLLLLLVFVIVYGSYLMPHRLDLNERMPYTFQVVGSHKVMLSAPFPPSATFWLGSDHRGYDLLSLLLNGASYTFLFAFGVTLIRFLIALPLGILAGVTDKGGKSIASLSVIFSSVPALLFVFPVMYGLATALHINNGMEISDPRNQLFASFLFVFLVVLGMFQVANQFAERTRFYRFKQYVEVATVIGASPWRVAIKHVLPHLRSEILFASLADIVSVLSVIGQLAVFGVFIGGGEIVQITPDESVTLTNVGEWGSLIAYGIKTIRPYPWIVLSVAVFFTVSIFILTLFSKQLQKRMNRPALYHAKPFLRNKKALVSTSLATCVFVLTPLLLTSKSPTAALSASETAKMISPSVSATITQYTTDFIGFLHNGDWKSAEAYLDEMAEHDNPQLLRSLQKYRGIRMVQIGKITKSGEEYNVNVLVQNTMDEKKELTLRLSIIGPLVRVLDLKENE